MSGPAWPPVYDDSYRPEASSPYWFPALETMAAGQREALILAKLQSVLTYVYAKSPFYRRKWDVAGIDVAGIRSLQDFARLPVTTKAELREAQAAHPPFGDYLGIPEAEIYHVHGTSGTTGRPTAFAVGRDDWRRIANAHARIMWGMGIRPSDTVFIASPFSLYVGSWGALAGAERLGARAFPFGAGAPGQTLMAVRWLREMRPEVFYGTPSYALYLAETARDQGLDPAADFGFRVMFFSGEPGAGLPAIKKRIEETFGASCIDSGSMGEMLPWMTDGECAERRGMHLWQDIVYTEVVDPVTYAAVPSGAEGTPVYTHLERTSQPMIRLLSGDLTTWTEEPCSCGRTYPRLPRGIYGRVDDMFIVRGENIYPSAIEETLRSANGFGGEFRVIITREEEMDKLLIQAEHQPGASNVEALGRTLEDRLKAVLGVRAMVRMVAPGTFERTEFKARRVVDQRDRYRQLGQEEA